MSRRFVVEGAAVILPTEPSGERYLYRSPAELPADGYTDAGLQHAEAVGLIRIIEIPDEKPDDQTGDDEPDGSEGDQADKPDGRASLAKLVEYATAKGIEIPDGADKATVKDLIDAFVEN